MGRYYEGDISGKFWFGVQPSNAADRFGSIGYEPSYAVYTFIKEDHLDTVKNELDVIRTTIGEDNIKLLDDFFEQNDLYSNIKMEEFNKDLPDIWNKHKSDYADYCLGLQIYNYLLEHDYCEFTAEL
jgi:hypothetical protein